MKEIAVRITVLILLSSPLRIFSILSNISSTDTENRNLPHIFNSISDLVHLTPTDNGKRTEQIYVKNVTKMINLIEIVFLGQSYEVLSVAGRRRTILKWCDIEHSRKYVPWTSSKPGIPYEGQLEKK